MTHPAPTIGVVGVGAMGGAFAAGLAPHATVTVEDALPGRAAEVAAAIGVSAGDAAACDVVVLAVKPQDLAEAIESLVPWDLRRRLDRLAPPVLATPAGVSAVIDYQAEGGPRADVRVQALFGLKSHPMVGEGRVPLTLALTSPAHRPIQITKDLPGFWAGSWKAVRTEMKGRYPRHPWPEDPAEAPPTVRAKPRGT